jgi:enoyl-CoA hydratase/carnithine racemase
MGARGGFGGIAQRGFAKPIIAAVNGSALAGGCEIMLACDLVVAVEGAMFGIPEVKRGLMAAAGALIRLPKRIPATIALEMALTGDPIDARRALELGLINRVVPQDQLMDEALELANAIAKNAPLAVRASKRVMQEAGELPDADGWAINNAAIPEVFGSADAMEGPVAFAEKREPVWTGK